MKKFKYKVVFTSLSTAQQFMDNLGKEGWELVNIIPLGKRDGVDDIRTSAIFKKEEV